MNDVRRYSIFVVILLLTQVLQLLRDEVSVLVDTDVQGLAPFVAMLLATI